MTRSILKRTVAAVGALALGTFAVLGTATAASAETVGNLDPTEDVSLTIHKYIQPDSGNLGPNDGTEIDDPVGTPLPGVTFSVYKVDLDLLDSANWPIAAGLVNGLAAGTIDVGDIDTVGGDLGGTTIAEGVLLTGVNEIGLYLVQETNSPSNVVAPVRPFLVGVPVAQGDGEWLYDVHVYPKNAVAEAPEKTVDDEDARIIGDEVEWTIESVVPQLPQGILWTNYRIVDQIDPRLTYQGVQVFLVDGDPEVITPLDVVTNAGHTAIVGDEGGTVDISLDSDSLELLDAASADAVVRTVILTEVASIDAIEAGDLHGVIENQATVYFNDPDNGFNSNTVDTQWGAVTVNKFTLDEEDDEVALAGAVFDIYDVDPASIGATPIVTGLTTDANGTFPAVSLKVGDYWLVETSAPAGYILPAAPDNAYAFEIEVGSVATAHIERIENQQVPVWELPLTGGSGTFWFTVGGIALLSMAVGGALIATHRRKVAA